MYVVLLPTSSSLLMLHWNGITWGRSFSWDVDVVKVSVISLAAVSSRSSFLDAITTLQPSKASSVVIARPIPVAPPVTTATLPANKPGRNTLLNVADAIWTEQERENFLKRPKVLHACYHHIILNCWHLLGIVISTRLLAMMYMDMVYNIIIIL